ncbi:UNVERIFIED_CONTAM: hypothetical protein GTU68_064155 [Idotea baltica]|nr:hypothetical protein [Idotea baltica]
MLKEKLSNYEIILASGSPRRQEYFNQLGIDFKIKLKEIEEVFPPTLVSNEITDYLAELKGKAFLSDIKENQIVVTSDTIVWHKNSALGKPKNKQDANVILQSMSDQWHEVITSVCFNLKDKQITSSCITKVKFKELTNSEIDFYLEQFKPYDKAGAYGIQEWIGLIAIEEIEGSYSNVVGLPTHLVYKMFTELIE